MTLVVAFDPGGSTGWATYSTEEDQWDGDQITDPDHHFVLYKLLSTLHTAYCRTSPENLIVVSESFEFRNDITTGDRRKGLELVSKEYIGVFKLFCQNTNVKYVEQMPSAAKGFVTDERLDKMGLLRRPVYENRHYHDACRHLVLFLVKQLGLKEKVLKSWKHQDE